METPKEFFTLPPGWDWEGDWEIEPKKGSLITEDFVVTEWVDKRYETINYFDKEDIISQWMNKVFINRETSQCKMRSLNENR